VLFAADAEGTIARCSPAAREVCGYDGQQLEGITLAELAAEDSRQQVEELIAAASDRPDQVQRAQLPMERPSGGRYWAELTLMAVHHGEEGQEARTLQGTIRDVTEQKMTQAIREIITGERPL
jgi:PAS domain S-box-containing protein